MRKIASTGNAGFDRFWAAYPKHVAKGDAEKAWRALKPSPLLVDEMIKALDWQRQQAQWVKDGGSFVPFPATWLRAKRWLDEAPAALRVVREIEADWTCDHTPHCGAKWTCYRKRELDAMKASA